MARLSRALKIQSLGTTEHNTPTGESVAMPKSLCSTATIVYKLALHLGHEGYEVKIPVGRLLGSSSGLVATSRNTRPGADSSA